MQPYIGQISSFGFGFAPKGWAFCNGQLLGVAQNSALFSLIGVQFGGNGQTTFALPNLQSRVPIHTGGDFVVGQMAGVEHVTLTLSSLSQHSHAMVCSTAPVDKATPSDSRYLGQAAVDNNIFGPTVTTALAPNAVGVVGGNQSHNNLQPCLAINFCIALVGIYPSRN